jgi:trimeric autotransporter adhesin
MRPAIQLKKTTLPLLIAVLLGVFAFPRIAQAVNPPPDGGYLGGNTAEGTQALNSLILLPGRGEVGGLRNTAIGYQTLFSDIVGSDNTATGYQALNNNTASFNSAFGGLALFGNTDGSHNSGVGWGALRENTTGNDNTAVGYNALTGSFTSQNNTAIGSHALAHTSIGARDNTAIGYQALLNTQGDLFIGLGRQNTGIGSQALYNNTTGNNIAAIGYQALYGASGQNSNGNIAIGSGSGKNLATGNSNIHIGNSGFPTDSLVIRIGETQTATFVAGISGVNEGSPTAVFINTTSGQLGTTPPASSRQYKKQIKPMDKVSEAILAFKPVTFQYKSDNKGTPQFGLIAEEVAEVNPDLVIHDSDGKPYTVRYDAVNAMLLNEFLKEHRTVEKLEATVAQQHKDFEAAVAELKRQIQKVSAQLELNKPAPQTVLNNE